MVLTESDQNVIKALRKDKKYSLKRILNEFLNRNYKKSTDAYFFIKSL